MKRFFYCVMLLGLGLLCYCAHDTEPKPLYASRFYTEKDAFMPNGWHWREDGFHTRPQFFKVSPNRELDEDDENFDERANLFTIRTAATSPSLYYYSGFFAVEDDSIIDVIANAAGKGIFSLGVEFYDADQNLIGERHQGFNLRPFNGDEPFKNYRFRLYFLANENRRARYVHLMFIVEPDTEIILRDISLSIIPYDINRMDSTYIRFKEEEAKQGRKQ